MPRKLVSFLTTRCPRCQFRYGARVAHRNRGRFLRLLFIDLFECHACNIRFHALCLPTKTAPGGPR